MTCVRCGEKRIFTTIIDMHFVIAGVKYGDGLKTIELCSKCSQDLESWVSSLSKFESVDW